MDDKMLLDLQVILKYNFSFINIIQIVLLEHLFGGMLIKLRKNSIAETVFQKTLLLNKYGQLGLNFDVLSIFVISL